MSTNPRRWRQMYESMHPASIAARAVKIALSEVGYTEEPEHGMNDNRYGRAWGQNYVAWCGLAVADWWKRAGFAVDQKLALQIDYVPTLVRMATQRLDGMFLVGKNRVRAGDAVAYDFPGGERADHVGLFVRWIDKQAGAFLAVEGNTSKAGSQSNGGAVLEKVRSMNEVAAFIRKVR